ncbi:MULTISPECIES: nucleoside hydrolase [unclassified Halanaerobium]|uniref:nucleoside hydrolase n=1 Tax=unclassified Halanaerobium TaxID=2641197 RepID=UPI000DF23C28|nr:MULTISPECIES: nucleoside hydrolase [unclassified Halanaerobium]RCW43763.1 ribosylpyrimidine nucleosidase [Halanaerobium sp. MA284_MarDTE_T2]RCW89168.1 ribosylpyrimidine nucleosidase [Halanaerobium sp. DL-01]
MRREKIILDVDPGHDDAIAILLAARADNLDLRGITVVAGNQILEKTLNNTLNIVNYADLKVPVYKGMAKPLVRKQVTAGHIHGESGLDGPDFPSLTLEAEKKHAVDFIIDEALKAEEGITLVPVGPLTNIAAAILLKPEIKDKINRIVMMGGAYGLGNRTPAAEFNIYADAEAADIIFKSGIDITMVGLDLTFQAQAYPEIIDRISKIGNKVTDLVVELLEFFGSTYQDFYGLKAGPLHDVCAVAKLIDDDVFTTRKMHVDIETDSSLTYGRTVCDYYDVTGKKKNAEVALDLNKEKFWDLLCDILGHYN